MPPGCKEKGSPRALFYLSKNLGGVTHFVFSPHPHAQPGIVGVEDIPAVARRSHPAIYDEPGLSLNVGGKIQSGPHVNIFADPGYVPDGRRFFVLEAVLQGFAVGTAVTEVIIRKHVVTFFPSLDRQAVVPVKGGEAVFAPSLVGKLKDAPFQFLGMQDAA